MSSIPEKNTSEDSYFKQIINNIPNNIGSYLPNIFPFGYHTKRSEPRLLYVMPVTMIYEGKKYSLKSKNISLNGLQTFISRTFIQEGKTVQITFDQFIETQNSVIGGMDQFTPFSNIEYRIKEVQHIAEKTYISLIQNNLDPLTKDFFERFIAGNRLRYKIDAADRICASKAQYYESLYTVNMQHVPMFIHWSQKSGFHIDSIIKTNQNLHFFNYINNNGQPDFSAFCFPQRIKTFAEMARSNQSAIMFTYWENEKFYSVFDFELNSSDEIPEITAKVKSCKGIIYKALTNLNKKPVAEKMTAMLSKIQKLDSRASEIINKRASESIAQVIFIDITRVFCRQNIFSQALEPDPDHLSALTVISNNKKESLADGHIIDHYDESLLHLPHIVNFNIDHHRYDARYQYAMTVSIKFDEHTYSAETIDFSRTGLGLVIKENIEIPNHSLIKITFSSLQIKGASTRLHDIPHRVMISRKRNDGLFLGVIRKTSECSSTVNHFFSNLVNRNKSKLDLCHKDKIDSVKTIFYEAFVTENMQTIPIVISKDRGNQHYVRDIGLTETPCALAEKLYIEGHGYDFRFLTTELRLQEFQQRAANATEKNSQSFMIFLFKDMDEYGNKTFSSITDFELKDDNKIEQFIDYTLRNKGSCIQIKFMNNLLIDKLYRNKTLDKVEHLNKSSVKLLAQEYKDIIGFAEMIDLTDEYRKLYHINPKNSVIES